MSYLRTHSIFLGFSALAALALAIGCSQSADESASSSADDSAGDAATDAGLPIQDLVISQVYGGGGNANATFQNDFVELFNRSEKAIGLKGYSIQYVGYDKSFVSNGNVLNLPDTTLSPGHYYLIQLAGGGPDSGTLNGAPLPSPDYVATSPTELINISQSDGKIAIVPSNALLNNCGAAGALCPTSSFIDMVGFGKATQYEGAPVQSLYVQGQPAQAAIRKLGGCMAFFDNAYDFTVGTAEPRNGATMPSPLCDTVDAGTPPPPPPPPSDDAGTTDGGWTHDGGWSHDGGYYGDGGYRKKDGGRGTTAGDDDDGLDTPSDPSPAGDDDDGANGGNAADAGQPPVFPATTPSCSTTMSTTGSTSLAGLFGLALVAGALRRRRKS